MAEEPVDEGTTLAKAQAEERRITLGARDDPNFKLPSGQTIAEVKGKTLEAHRKEAAAADKAQGERMVELHKLSEPLVSPEAKVEVNKEGGLTILPPKVEEPKIPGDGGKKEPPPPPPPDMKKAPPPPATTGSSEGDKGKTT